LAASRKLIERREVKLPPEQLKPVLFFCSMEANARARTPFLT